MCRNRESERLKKSNAMAGHFSQIKSEILTLLMATLHSELLAVAFLTRIYDSCGLGKDVTWKS